MCFGLGVWVFGCVGGGVHSGISLVYGLDPVGIIFGISSGFMRYFLVHIENFHGVF